jgi:hypothetical protein
VAAAVTLGGATAPASLAGDPVLQGSGFDSLDSTIALYAPPIVQTSLLAKSAAARARLLDDGPESVCAATRTLGALELETAALAGQFGFSLEGASTIADRANAIVSELRATHPPSPCIPPGPPQLPG